MAGDVYCVDETKGEMYRAADNHVVVSPVQFGRVGEIIVPDSARGSMPPVGVVVHVGPGLPDNAGGVRQPPCKAGDWIIFGSLVHAVMQDHHQRVRMFLPFSAVLGVIEPEMHQHVSMKLAADAGSIRQFCGTE